MNKILKSHSEELKAALKDLKQFHQQIEVVFSHLKEAFLKGHIVYIAGNGGSATQAQHLSDEMVGRYKSNRPPYPVVALTADSAVLTCIGNDFGYEHVFARQLEALGKQGDVFIGLSTSGTSPNVLAAVEVAKAKGMTVIGLTGPKGKLREVADYVIEAPAASTARMQELHLHAIHMICELFEPENYGA
jgi:D-sedoheptulose 7-phosphate isomerase